MPSLYTFTDYSPQWPTEFEREAERLRALLGKELIAVHHIGSTSVPGLAAKPTIDLLPVVRSLARVDEATPQLVAAGYKAWGEYGIAGRRFFTKDRGAFRTHNLHAFVEGHPAIERHLAFCAYLRSHENVRGEYARSSAKPTSAIPPISRPTAAAKTPGSSVSSPSLCCGIAVIVAVRSAKGRCFAERKTTIRRPDASSVSHPDWTQSPFSCLLSLFPTPDSRVLTPMDDPLFPLLLVFRYLHILGAIALMGGTIFMRFALAPAVGSLGEPAKAELHEGVRSRWAKFVMLAAAMLLISGLANMVLFTSRRYDLDPVPLLGAPYGMVVGIKFLLALPIFFIASFLAGRTAAAKRFQASGVMWMNVNLVLALLMVLIGGLLKFVGRDYKGSEPPVAAVAAAETGEMLSPAGAGE